MNLANCLKINQVSTSAAAQRAGLSSTVFYDVFNGRVSGFTPKAARKIMQTWPEWNLQWEDLLFYKERFLSGPRARLTEEEQRTLEGLLEPVRMWIQARPEAREFVFKRLNEAGVAEVTP